MKTFTMLYKNAKILFCHAGSFYELQFSSDYLKVELFQNSIAEMAPTAIKVYDTPGTMQRHSKRDFKKKKKSFLIRAAI
jgi:hypothetical protein